MCQLNASCHPAAKETTALCWNIPSYLLRENLSNGNTAQNWVKNLWPWRARVVAFLCPSFATLRSRFHLYESITGLCTVSRPDAALKLCFSSHRLSSPTRMPDIWPLVPWSVSRGTLLQTVIQAYERRGCYLPVLHICCWHCCIGAAQSYSTSSDA